MIEDREIERLAALRDLGVLDTDAEPILDNLTRLAAVTFQAPVALISLVDCDRQWFKARVGLDALQTPRDVAFCDHAIRSCEVMIVPDATQDPRFRANPLVIGDPNIRFYAGAPLVLPGGQIVGALCVIDYAPRHSFTSANADQLKSLADCVVDALIQRREALEAARIRQIAEERQQLLEMAGDMARIGTWSWDLATDEVIWSDETYRVHWLEMGAPAPDLVRWFGYYHAEDAAALARRFSRAASDGGEFGLSVRIVDREGGVTYAMIRGGCRRNAGGKVTGLFGTCQDVTHLKLADVALRESEGRFRHLAEAASDIISEKTIDGVITYVSPACLPIFGRSPDEMIGQNAFDMIEPDDVVRLRESCDALVASRGQTESRPVEYRTRQSGGDEIWLESKPTVILDPETGEVTGFMDIIRDITSRKRLEESLTQAKVAAEAAAVAKAEFLANMSHEIRTPLTAIIGFAGLLEWMELPEGAKSYVDRIATGGRALLSVVNDILDFSKLEAGQIQLNAQPFELAPWVEDIVDLVGEQAQTKKVALKVELDPDLPRVVCADAARLRQVTLNLLSNAVKFTPKGSVTLRVSYAAGPATRLRISITDTGIGIPAARMDRLFKRFSQVDGSTTREHGGAGLGLAICKSLVEMMGGAIGVESAEGRGSTFWFTVEAATADSGDTGGEQASPMRDLSSARILVVDDVSTNRELVSALVSPLGPGLFEAVNGAEAVEAADRTAFDLILMDLQMPVMGGLEAARRIRAASRLNRTTPIIAFSANVLPHHLAACREAGLEDHIAKPVDPADLLTKVYRWIGREDSPAILAAAPASCAWADRCASISCIRVRGATLPRRDELVDHGQELLRRHG